MQKLNNTQKIFLEDRVNPKNELKCSVCGCPMWEQEMVSIGYPQGHVPRKILACPCLHPEDFIDCAK